MRILTFLVLAFGFGFANFDENFSANDSNLTTNDANLTTPNFTKREFFKDDKEFKKIESVKIPTH